MNRTLPILLLASLGSPLAAEPSAATETSALPRQVNVARAGAPAALAAAAHEVDALGDRKAAEAIRKLVREIEGNGSRGVGAQTTLRAYCDTIEQAWASVAAAYDAAAQARADDGQVLAADLLRRRKHASRLSLYAWAPWAVPRALLDRARTVPDLTQTAASAKLPGGGRTCCGPVSAANSLAWLARNGYPRLALGETDRTAAAAALARTLSGPKYMKTSMTTGTGAVGVIRGVRKLLAERKCVVKRLEYQGWRGHPKDSSTGVAVPQLAWMKKALLGSSGVWLNVGWYKYDKKTDAYERVGGHWVTLVGYRVERRKTGEATVLVLHDPSPKAGTTFANEYALAEPIASGKLTGKQAGLPRSAAGYFKLTEGMHVSARGDAAILDGVVVLELAP